MPQTKLHSVYDEVFSLSPKPLQESCLSKITRELPVLTAFDLVPTAIVEECNTLKEKQFHFIQDIVIPDKMAEMMLEDFSKKGALRHDTLSLFSDVAKYNLKVLKLSHIDMNMAGRALMKYSTFSLRELQLGCNRCINMNISMDRWSVRKLCDSFAGSRYSLTSLRMDLYPDVNITAGTIFDYFIQFPNLKLLEYNTPVMVNDHVTFTNNNWNSLCVSCPQLQVLHIGINGSPKGVELDSQIFTAAQKLRSLSLFSALKSDVAVESFGCVEYFLQLDNLRELDLSIDMDPPDTNLIQLPRENSEGDHTDLLAGYFDRFLELSIGKLEFLEALDLSGIYRMNDMKIQTFIETHRNLRFLGLCMLQSKFCLNGDAVAYYPQLKIAGCYLESQIIISLLKYSKRATYMKEVLKGLFQVTAGWTEARRPYVLKVVLEVMEEFKGHMQLQMAATACVFHLTKEREGIEHELNIELLSEIARVTSMILVGHVENLQMVKNCLLIICTDRILHKARFDRVTMSRLCLKCMINYPESVDRHVTRMAVAIISILACKISSKDTANLMKEKEMKLLLDIVEQRLKAKLVDGTLKFDLSALWNLTDESPAACKRFVDLDGPTKYLQLLEVFADDMQVETKVLGLLNNIAEVEFLQVVMLLNRPLMERVRSLIGNEQVQVSYFACGIIANLALRWDDVVTVLQVSERNQILEELNGAIDRWGILETEIVTYRSFKPFYELLGCLDKPEIQRWAVWAIHHVCSLCSHLYKDLMDATCLRLLKDIYVTQRRRPHLHIQIENIYKKTGNAHLLNDMMMMQIDESLNILEDAAAAMDEG